MSVLLNTGFTIHAPAPIDSRMQVSTFAGLDAIVVKYEHMLCHVIDEDKDYRYYKNIPGWVPVNYGSTVNWGDIQGNILSQVDLINYLTLNYSDINHTHNPIGPHTHPPADITDINSIVTWVREHEALNYILTGSVNSTGVFQGTMNNFSVTDGVNTALIEDGEVLTFSPDFTVDVVNQVISYQETDPTVGAHIKAITTADISQWDAGYAHSLTSHNYEYWLGTPAGEGYVLVSSVLGVRSWVNSTSIGVVDHLLLTNIGVNSHIQIDSHIADTAIHQDTWKPNTSAQEGYVTSGAGQASKFWGTDVNGNPGWVSGNGITGAAEIHDQAIAATVWTFVHNLLTLNPNIQVWSTSLANGEVIIPEKIITISNTTVEIHFSTATSGRATAILGGIVSNDVSGLVPYTNASNNVDLGLFNIQAAAIIKSGGLSSEFLKADGSVDSNSYAADILALQTEQTTQDTAIALNTSKVSVQPDIIGVTELKPELKGFIDLGDVSGTLTLDYSSKIGFKFNMVGNTTLAFTNVIAGKSIELIYNPQTYVLTHPAGFVAAQLSGFTASLTNYETIYCPDANVPIFKASIDAR